MDDSRFDRLSKQLAAGESRRGLLRAITGVSLVGAGALLVAEDGEARARRGAGVQSEHWGKKKRTYCLDGETIRRYRRKQRKLLAKGATLGKCPTTPICTPDCAGKECGPDGCGGTCGPGCTGITCCNSAGACVDGTTPEACGAGGTCQVCVEPETCIAFTCGNIE